MEGSIGLFNAYGNGQSVSMAAEFSGNSLRGLMTAVVVSGGSALVR